MDKKFISDIVVEHVETLVNGVNETCLECAKEEISIEGKYAAIETHKKLAAMRITNSIKEWLNDGINELNLPPTVKENVRSQLKAGI